MTNEIFAGIHPNKNLKQPQPVVKANSRPPRESVAPLKGDETDDIQRS